MPAPAVPRAAVPRAAVPRTAMTTVSAITAAPAVGARTAVPAVNWTIGPTSAPTVPAVGTSPAEAGVVGVSTPIPTGPMPPITVPVIVATPVEELHLFNRR